MNLSNDITTTKVISFNASAPPATFSISLDGNTAAGDQSVTTLGVGTGSVVPIQLFADGYPGCKRGFRHGSNTMLLRPVMKGSIREVMLPNAQVLAVPAENPTAIDISVVSFGGQATADSGMVGSVRFRNHRRFFGHDAPAWYVLRSGAETSARASRRLISPSP